MVTGGVLWCVDFRWFRWFRWLRWLRWLPVVPVVVVVGGSVVPVVAVVAVGVRVEGVLRLAALIRPESPVSGDDLACPWWPQVAAEVLECLIF